MIMKNRKLILALLVSFGFFATSCSSDDNEGETLAPLAGKWELTQVGTVVNGVETLVDAPQNAADCDKDYLELRVSNVAIDGDYDSTISKCNLTTREGTYNRSHNNLTVTMGGTATTSDIVNLTLKELKLKNAAGVISVYERD